MKRICLFLVKVVHSTDRKDGQKQGELGSLWAEADRMEEGQMMMEQIEVCGEVEVDSWQRWKYKISTKLVSNNCSLIFVAKLRSSG